MSDHLITWECGYTNITAATLAALNTALINTYGLVAVGAPQFNTFGADGISAVARYQKGTIIIMAEGGVVAITVRIRQNANWAGIKTLFKTTLGLTNLLAKDSLGINENVLEN